MSGCCATQRQHARIIETRWDAYARTDVVATADPSRRLVFTDGGAGTFMLHWDGDPAATSARCSTTWRPPRCCSGRTRNVLVIGAGGGIDVVRRFAAGARHVTAVELNASTVAAVRRSAPTTGTS